MRFSAKCGRAWMGLGGLLGLAMGLGSAHGQQAGPECVDCASHRHKPSAHAPGYTPYMAPVVVEKRGGLLGRKRYSVTVYHQVAGEDPKPVAGPNAAPVGAPPSVVANPRGTALAESAPPPSYDPNSYNPAPDYAPGEPAYGPDVLADVAPGEPVPVGVMRTSYDQYPGGPVPAAPSGIGSSLEEPGRASTTGVAAPAAPAIDPGIAMWHTVIPPGGSLVAGGEKKSFLDRMTDGENMFTRWAEARQARKVARFYRNSGLVPYSPHARSVPSAAIMPSR